LSPVKVASRSCVSRASVHRRASNFLAIQ
jgi:hypothetical protein